MYVVATTASEIRTERVWVAPTPACTMQMHRSVHIAKVESDAAILTVPSQQSSAGRQGTCSHQNDATHHPESERLFKARRWKDVLSRKKPKTPTRKLGGSEKRFSPQSKNVDEVQSFNPFLHKMRLTAAGKLKLVSKART